MLQSIAAVRTHSLHVYTGKKYLPFCDTITGEDVLASPRTNFLFAGRTRIFTEGTFTPIPPLLRSLKRPLFSFALGYRLSEKKCSCPKAGVLCLPGNTSASLHDRLVLKYFLCKLTRTKIFEEDFMFQADQLSNEKIQGEENLQRRPFYYLI